MNRRKKRRTRTKSSSMNWSGGNRRDGQGKSEWHGAGNEASAATSPIRNERKRRNEASAAAGARFGTSGSAEMRPALQREPDANEQKPENGRLGGLLAAPGASWSVLASWRPLGAILGPSWGHLGGLLGSSWGHLGAILAPLGASWAPLGAILEAIAQRRAEL